MIPNFPPICKGINKIPSSPDALCARFGWALLVHWQPYKVLGKEGGQKGDGRLA